MIVNARAKPRQFIHLMPGTMIEPGDVLRSLH